MKDCFWPYQEETNCSNKQKNNSLSTTKIPSSKLSLKISLMITTKGLLKLMELNNGKRHSHMLFQLRIRRKDQIWSINLEMFYWNRREISILQSSVILWLEISQRCVNCGRRDWCTKFTKRKRTNMNWWESSSRRLSYLRTFWETSQWMKTLIL